MTSNLSGSQTNSPIFPGLLALGFLLAGAYVIFLSLGDIIQAGASSRWTKTTGTVIESRVTFSGGTRHRGPGVFNYYPVVTYRYSVDGAPRVADKIYPTLFWSQGSAKQFVEAHPMRSQLEVYFSPANPADAMLLPGLRLGTFQRFICGTSLASVGLLCAVGCFRYFDTEIFGISLDSLSNVTLLLIIVQVVYLFLSGFYQPFF